MLRLRLTLLALLLFCPGAAAPATPCAGLSPDQCWAFRCPAAGTIAEYQGRREEHLGPAAGDAHLCRVAAAPAEQLWLYSLIEVSGDPPTVRQAWRAALSGLFPAIPGTTITFPRPDEPAMREVFTIVSIGPVNTAFGQRRAVVVERSFEGTSRSRQVRGWAHMTLDAETGVRLAILARARIDGREMMADPVEAVGIIAPRP